jgi:hypothetical protein
MKTLVPTMHGIIDRRMLVNFRVQADVIRKLLPLYFQSKLVKGWAMAGVCLIRLKDIRPNGIHLPCGMTSENAAHRIAVEWKENGALREGVFIPRRDTSSPCRFRGHRTRGRFPIENAIAGWLGRRRDMRPARRKNPGHLHLRIARRSIGLFRTRLKGLFSNPQSKLLRRP